MISRGVYIVNVDLCSNEKTSREITRRREQDEAALKL